ncbi:MAG: YihY/virulence factor BrkB family protein [Thiohalocapsa sp.]|jgi:membrane protein|uniref:YihY/virulence factor BrkB family protein n=1 Tax=Thiohalocapsa sp. TaxID=2497641 RepID=UPI0025F5C8EE|nr:YhjD/YihY/BrkB family envelope integrity protein [Thiohalocapsa sp.]MCG6942604.1 YihY/virulence factor BrkB family protein [Thiohalocapsa sp.]
MYQPFQQAFLIIRTGVELWLEHNAFLHAGALAFFTLFSLAPTLIIAVTVIGVVLGEGAAQGQIVEQLKGAMGVDAAVFVEQAILAARIDEAGLMPTVVGVGALLIGATTVFGQLRYSLNVLWGVRPGPGRSRFTPLTQFAKTRLLALLVVLLIGLGFLLYFIAVTGLQLAVAYFHLKGWDLLPALQLDMLSWAARSAVAVLITTLFIAALFKVLPDLLVTWRDVLPGALVTALMLTAGRYGIAAFLSTTAIASAYGAAASLLVILMWVYFSALLLLLGAALTRAYLGVRGPATLPGSL